MGDNIALIRFERGWEPDSPSPETGMPRYKPVIKIIKSRPPTTEFRATATEDDFRNPDYREAYETFEREEKGRTTTPDEGYPLVFWPAIEPSDMMGCFAHGIYTVEQLAKLTSTRSVSLPPSVIEIAKRAARMVELAKAKGKYEVMITELQDQIAAVREDNNQMRTTITAQNTQLEILRARALMVA